MLPEGWSKTTVGDGCTIKNHLRQPLSAKQRIGMKGPFPYFGPTGIIDSLDHYRIEETIALIGEDGDHFLKFKKREMTIFFEGKSNVNNHAHVIGDSATCMAKWFYYSFMHRDLTPVLSRQGVGRYKLTKAGLMQLELLLPPPKEQAQVVALLDTWKDAITTVEKILANSRQHKQMLMQSLLTGRRRHLNSDDPWRTVTFDEIFERIIRKNSAANQNVLTISGQYGLVGQREFFSKHVASENLQTYALLERFDFAYNKSYSAGYPMGAIKPLMAHDFGVVSSLYICFRIRPDVDADHDFFRHYFEAGLLNEELSGIAQEGARNHGLLNVSVTDFFKLQLHVPPAPIQRKIAEVINVAEAEERIIARQLQHLQTEKRALMEQLLTGKRRLPCATAETESVA